MNRIRGVQSAVQNFHDDTQITRQSKHDQRARLINWLGAVFTDDTYQNSLAIRHTSTGKWIFDLDAFKQWLPLNMPGEKSKLLWIHGGPGFGKTVLCATIIEFLKSDTNRNLVYHFCNSEHEEKRDPMMILRSWIAQLLLSDDKALRIAFEVFQTNALRPPTPADLWNILRRIVSLIRCTLVIDGFDECSTASIQSKYNKRDGRTEFVRSLLSEIDTETRVLLVSREHNDIRSGLDGYSEDTAPCLLEHAITYKDTKTDVLTCSKHIMSTKLANKSDELRDEIAAEAAKNSAGMFLYLSLLGQELNAGDTAQNLRKIVAEMPIGLDKAYDRELRRIAELQEDRRNQALSLLRWILFAVRPLSICELAEALALADNMTTTIYPFDALPETWSSHFVDEHYVNANIIKYCGSLIELRKNREDESLAQQTVHFVHASAREYLLKQQPREEYSGLPKLGFNDLPAENDRLASLCLRYLCYDVFNGADKIKVRRRIKKFPFLFYATTSWYKHARIRNFLSRNLEPDIEKLFDPNTGNWVLWSEIFEGELLDQDTSEPEEPAEGQNDDTDQASHSDEWDDPGDASSLEDIEATPATKSENAPFESKPETSEQSVPTEATDIVAPHAASNPMYYASLLGLTNVVRSLRAKGLNPNAAGGRFGFPLEAAIESGYQETIDYIVGLGADINQAGGFYGSCVGAAAAVGTLSLVSLLLEKGARADVCNAEGLTPLHFACRAGQPEIAKILLEHQSSLVQSKTRAGDSPFCYAVESGKLELVKLLLSNGADVNDKDGDTIPVLVKAAANGLQYIAKEIISYKANIEAQTPNGSRALHYAAWGGHEKLVRLLVARKAMVNASTNDGTTSLHFAVSAQSLECVNILLRKEANVNQLNATGGGALSIAGQLGNVPIARVLLKHGADIHNKNCCNWTPLYFAVYHKHLEIAKLLLENYAATSDLAIEGDIAIDKAIKNSDHKMLVLLLQHGALQDLGAEEEGTSESSILPHAAFRAIISNDQVAFLTRLEEMDMSSISPRAKGATLMVSVIFNCIDLVRCLIEKKVDLSCHMTNRRTVLHLAAQLAATDILGLLLDQPSAPVHARDVLGSTPLHVAIGNGQLGLKCIECFLEHGALFEADNSDFQPKAPSPDGRSQMEGVWEGKFTYVSWWKGQFAPTSLIINFDTELSKDRWHLPTFRFNDADETLGPYLMIGYASGETTMRFIRLWYNVGRLCDGKVEKFEDGSVAIKGNWGQNENRWFGTFEVIKKSAG